jgi:hypothetical protein
MEQNSSTTRVMSSAVSSGPDLTYAGDRMTPEQMETRIYSGAPNMPSYNNNITQQQLSDLLAFLSSSRRRPAAHTHGAPLDVCGR